MPLLFAELYDSIATDFMKHKHDKYDDHQGKLTSLYCYNLTLIFSINPFGELSLLNLLNDLGFEFSYCSEIYNIW